MFEARNTTERVLKKQQPEIVEANETAARVLQTSANGEF